MNLLRKWCIRFGNMTKRINSHQRFAEMSARTIPWCLYSVLLNRHCLFWIDIGVHVFDLTILLRVLNRHWCSCVLSQFYEWKKIRSPETENKNMCPKHFFPETGKRSAETGKKKYALNIIFFSYPQVNFDCLLFGIFQNPSWFTWSVSTSAIWCRRRYVWRCMSRVSGEAYIFRSYIQDLYT